MMHVGKVLAVLIRVGAECSCAEMAGVSTTATGQSSVSFSIHNPNNAHQPCAHACSYLTLATVCIRAVYTCLVGVVFMY